MEPVGVLDAYDKLVNIWEKKRGVILSALIIIISHFLIYGFFTAVPRLIDPIHLVLLLLLFILTLVWLVSTNRILVKDSGKVGVFISIICEEAFELKAKSLFGHLIEKLSSDKNFKIINVSLLPINEFKDTQAVHAWLHAQTGDRNAVILLDIRDGKIDSEETVVVENLSCSGFFKRSSLLVDGESLNVKSELAFRMRDKDWQLLEKNSLNDKQKLRDNLRDVILYYAGLFYLNEREFENARLILKEVDNPREIVIPGVIDPQNKNKVKVKINTKHIQAGRLNYLLIRVYQKCILDHLLNNKPTDAIKLLKEVESFSLPPEEKVKNLINFAQAYFRLGNIPVAKDYTRKIHEINPQSFAYAVNMGFFAAMENNSTEFVKYYSQINEHKERDADAIPTIAFIEDYKGKYPRSQVLFDAASAILTKLFVDEVDGNTRLQNVIAVAIGSDYKSVKKLCEKKLRMKWPKDAKVGAGKGKKAA